MSLRNSHFRVWGPEFSSICVLWMRSQEQPSDIMCQTKCRAESGAIPQKKLPAVKHYLRRLNNSNVPTYTTISVTTNAIASLQFPALHSKCVSSVCHLLYFKQSISHELSSHDAKSQFSTLLFLLSSAHFLSYISCSRFNQREILRLERPPWIHPWPIQMCWDTCTAFTRLN